MLLEEMGGSWMNPLSFTWATGLNSFRTSPPLKLQTAIDSIVNNKRLW